MDPDDWPEIPLYIDDAEVAKRLGVDLQAFIEQLPDLEAAGFPLRDKLLDNKRYWRAVRDWIKGTRH